MASAGAQGERKPLLGQEEDPGRPATSPFEGRKAACAAVLLVEILERIAFFGIVSNLVLYLNSSNFNWGGTQASRAALLFIGASYLLSPIGGWLADTYLGRYWTITFSFLLYLVSACLLPVTASQDGRLSLCGEMPAYTVQPTCQRGSAECKQQLPSQYCAPFMYSGLLLLALGISSVRTNLTPFGADQVREFASHSACSLLLACLDISRLWLILCYLSKAKDGFEMAQLYHKDEHFQHAAFPSRVITDKQKTNFVIMAIWRKRRGCLSSFLKVRFPSLGRELPVLSFTGSTMSVCLLFPLANFL